MGQVIFAASPLGAFLGPLRTIGFLLVAGVIAIALAVLRRNQGKGARLALGGAGLILLIAGAAVPVVTLLSASRGTQKVALTLDNKRVVEQTCGDNGDTCTSYTLESTTSSTAYIFEVPKGAYDLAQVGTCYEFTYYPNKGLFASDTASYQRISNLARIESADPPTCQ